MNARVGGAADAELESLLGAVCLGCRPSFSRVYGLTSPRVFAAVLRINQNRPEAEEVLQEVYLKAWSRCAQFDPRRGPVIFWLLGIARHSAISSLRERNVRPQRPFTQLDSDVDPFEQLASAEPEPLEVVIRSRDAQAVRRCLGELSSAHRECVMLAYYSDLTHQEIGHRVGRPLGTVKSWVRRSLVTMRAGLARQCDAGS